MNLPTEAEIKKGAEPAITKATWMVKALTSALSASLYVTSSASSAIGKRIQYFFTFISRFEICLIPGSDDSKENQVETVSE